MKGSARRGPGSGALVPRCRAGQVPGARGAGRPVLHVFAHKNLTYSRHLDF